MFSRYVFVSVLAMFMLIIHPVQASVSQAVPVCSVKGVVLSEGVREAVGRGISEGRVFKYHDIKLNVIENSIASEADKAAHPGYTVCDNMGEQTYQKRGERKKKDAELVGQCIQALTNISGDGNFQFGNWIYDIKVLEKSACEAEKE